MDIDHIGVLVRDYEGSVQLAQDVLGFGEPVASFEAPEHQGLAGTFFQLGDAKVELFKLDETFPGRLPDGAPSVLDHIAVTTDDLDAEQERLAAKGVRFTGPATTDEITEPIELRGKRHLWTDPATSGGYRIQITGP
jgi:catechol 2,3-dioxygenase-like lactoylglutathione lyase family enzyme